MTVPMLQGPGEVALAGLRGQVVVVGLGHPETGYLLRADGSVRRVNPSLPFHNPDEVAQPVARSLTETS